MTPVYRGGALLFSAPRGTYRGPKPGFLPHVDIPIQAVVPGSTINGKAYTWEPGHAPWERDIAEAPQALIDAYHKSLGSKSKPSGAESVDDQRQPPAPRIDLDQAHMIEAARKWLRNEAPHAGDGREATCLVVSTLFSRFALSPETAVDVLMDGDDSWNEKQTKYPWGYDEDDNNGGSLIRLARDLYARRTKAPGSSARAKLEDVFDVEDVEAPTPELAVAHAARVAAAADFDDLADYGFTTFAEMQAQPQPYVVKGWMSRGQTSCWFGPPDQGKSAVLLNCALHVAADREWAGCRVKHGLVIFCAYERGNETEERAAAARKKLGVDGDLPFVLLKKPPNITTKAGVDRLLALIKKIEARYGVPCVLVIIDTLTASAPGWDLDKSMDMSAHLRRVQDVREATGAHFAVIHHPSKADPKNARGSGALLGHVDAEVNLHEKKITMQKKNGGKKPGQLTFTLEGVPMGVDEDGDPYDVVFANASPAHAPAESGGDVRAPMPITLGPVAELEVKIIEAVYFRARDGGEPFTTDELRDVLKNNGDLLTDDDDAVTPTARSHFARALKNLRKQKRIGRDGKRVLFAGQFARAGDVSAAELFSSVAHPFSKEKGRVQRATRRVGGGATQVEKHQ